MSVNKLVSGNWENTSNHQTVEVSQQYPSGKSRGKQLVAVCLLLRLQVGWQ